MTDQPQEPPAPTLDERIAIAETAAAVQGGQGADDGYDLPEPGPSIYLPGPGDPMAAARAILAIAQEDGAPPYRYWRGDYYRHAGSHWEIVDKAEITKWLYLITENAYWLKPAKGGGHLEMSWAPNRKKIGDLAAALSEGLIAHTGDEERCIALQNGVYNIKTDRLDPHTPRRFNTSALPFAYDPNAECPRWLAFLDQVLPGDTEAQELLGEWFGYVLSGRTDIHKILSMVGQPRCGKGTTARVLEAMLGAGMVASPTLSQLGGSFGEESLIGRKLAVMSDVRWTAAATAEATPVLLAVSGGDSRTVARKNRTAWHGYLGVRFMIMGNDIPNFRDASGALAGRMMQIHFPNTFAGREDTTLTAQLLNELPGIFRWAIEGLHRLNRRGYFRTPASSEQLAAEVRRTASPYQAFIEDFCEIDAQASTAVPDLLRAYGQWARREERTNDRPTAASLSRGLRTTDGRITADPQRRTLPNGQKVTMLRGIKLAVAPTWIVGDRAEEHALMAAAQVPPPDPLWDDPPD